MNALEPEAVDYNERCSNADAFHLDSRYHINNISIDICKIRAIYNAVSVKQIVFIITFFFLLMYR